MNKDATLALGACMPSLMARMKELEEKNNPIADWLVPLTNNHRNKGSGLCFLHLCNVKSFKWRHKRVYRISRELELNQRIKPRHRLVRENPLQLAAPTEINQS